MSLHDQIKKTIITSLALNMRPENIDNAHPLFGPEGIGLDSMAAVIVAMAIEKKFDISNPDTEAAEKILMSVNSIAEYVSSSSPGSSARP